ncbi:PREDICTED: E3 ubiquitin-protein ligase RNF216-like [Ceratosolen solmsi marchali]|uniref:E3 ubiquitin-protein ligase RNF216-like n=1 Tax=Ceratosolen solmsi marchali TaxID=326594 RepID=A0AAJ6VLG5_9HYME|nr:PREDICTED: E3 ubiquitin-protein ligase RNF216-like [Ceratosolen solmsi marchali]
MDTISCTNNHKFCKKCIIQGFYMHMRNGKMSLQCFANCPVEFSIETMKKILPVYILNMMEGQQQEREILRANIQNLVTCPLCNFWIEIDPEFRIIYCKNFECMQISCRLCRKENHLPLLCDQVAKEHALRVYNEERLSKDVIRICYNCKTRFIKDKGFVGYNYYYLHSIKNNPRDK